MNLQYMGLYTVLRLLQGKKTARSGVLNHPTHTTPFVSDGDTPGPPDSGVLGCEAFGEHSEQRANEYPVAGGLAAPLTALIENHSHPNNRK